MCEPIYPGETFREDLDELGMSAIALVKKQFSIKTNSENLFGTISFALQLSLMSGYQSGCMRNEATCASQPLRDPSNIFEQPRIGQG